MQSRHFNPRPRAGNGSGIKSSFPHLWGFQSTSPRGERPASLRFSTLTPPFQSTSPRGERPRSRRQWRFPQRFQSTSPRGERPRSRCCPHQRCHFNPRPRAGNGARPSLKAAMASHFNPRPRAGNGFFFFGGGAFQQIAIHVPARGTALRLHPLHSRGRFQSTSPRGERRASLAAYALQRRHFNPRPRAGNGGIKLLVRHICRLFQSTSPRGERPQKIMQIFYKSTFKTNIFANFCASSEKITPYRIMKAPYRPEFKVQTCKGTFVHFLSAQVL